MSDLLPGVRPDAIPGAVADTYTDPIVDPSTATGTVTAAAGANGANALSVAPALTRTQLLPPRFAPRLLLTLGLAILLAATVACNRSAEEPEAVAPAPRATMAVQSIAAPAVDLSSGPFGPPAPVDKLAVKPDIPHTATALFLQMQATPPPSRPATGGGEAGERAEGAPAAPLPLPLMGGGPGIAATPVPLAPATGGGGPPASDSAEYGYQGRSSRFAPPTPGLPPDLAATATALAYGSSQPAAPFGREDYGRIIPNVFHDPGLEPLSTLSIDVDTAAYSNVRRMIEDGNWPPADAVRIEEFVNYFSYADPLPDPSTGVPFGVRVEVAGHPWAPERRLVRLGIRGREIERRHRPAVNLVFLVDVSGSMSSPDKLPLVRESLRMLTYQLRADDRVAIVTYAGNARTVLGSTPGDHKQMILGAIDQLTPGGGTNGAAGIVTAYEKAREGFLDGGVNRVVLATDGDFNVGLTSTPTLTDFVAEQAAEGIALTAVGYGMGNLQDDRLESLSNRGDGNYAYIDSLEEASKVFVDQVTATLVTIARDVKLQVEFNPAEVGAYRLLGYENRLLAPQDFNDDTVDAGEVGAGHTLTVLYEIAPPGVSLDDPAVDDGAERPLHGGTGADDPDGRPAVDPLRYQDRIALTEHAERGELLSVKVRWKEPENENSALLTVPVFDHDLDFAEASDDLRFAAAVAAFGLALREAESDAAIELSAVLRMARGAIGLDPGGYRTDFVSLAEQALLLQERRSRIGMLSRP